MRYQIYAFPESGRAVRDCPLRQLVASYTEANEWSTALERCLKQFPVADGWTKHYVVNLDTNERTEQDEGFSLEDFT